MSDASGRDPQTAMNSTTASSSSSGTAGPAKARSPPHSPPKTSDQRPAKRKRRALSCTPCIKRKTRCSALGTVPCESCVKRGRPHECVWDHGDDVVVPPAALAAAGVGSSASVGAAELAALRAEVDELRATLNAHLAQCRPPNHPAPAVPPSTLKLPSIDRLPAASNGRSTFPSSWSLSAVPEFDRKVETAVAGLEELVTAGGAPLRPEAQHISYNQGSSPAASLLSVSAVSPPTPLGVRNSPSSRIPAMIDSTLRDDALWDSIASVVPSPESSHVLVNAYLASPYHKSWHVLLGPVFLREHRIFCADPSSPKLRGVDPTWIALYLMVIAFAIKSLTLDEVALVWPRYDLQEVARLPRALYEASLLALKVGRCDAVPQVRHVQTSLLFVTFLFHFGPASDGTAAMQHLGSATSTLQWLGMDRLGNDLKKLPKDDLALRDLHPAVAFELVKVLFHSVSLLDGTMSKRLGICRLAESMSGPSATALPTYWNDADLEANAISSRPASRWVDSSTARLGSLFASENRKFMKEVDAQNQEPTLETVMRYETGLRGVLVQVPLPDREPSGIINFMQCTLVCSINNRLLRAHRPYMVRGYTDPRCSHSKAAALDSARSIIATQRLMMACPEYRPTFVNRWILGAAFVLAIDYAVGPGGNDQAVAASASKRRDIVSALEIFRQPNPRDPTPDVTDQCARTVQALLEVAAKSAPGTVTDLGGFFQQVKDLLAQFTDTSANDPVITSPQLASIQNPAPLPLDFDWSLLMNSGAFPDGMNLEQATAYTTQAAFSFRLD